MTCHEIDQGKTVRERMAEEGRIREKTDKDGNRWTKVYFGDDIDELPDIVDQELGKRLKV